MGTLLSAPITEKETESGQGHRFTYGASAMQGWRTGMEDAHINELQLDENTALFGVYDGHGGREVAKYIKRHLPQVLKANPAFAEKDFPTALIQSYLQLDRQLTTIDGKREMHEFAEKKTKPDFLDTLTKFIIDHQDGKKPTPPNSKPSDDDQEQKPEASAPETTPPSVADDIDLENVRYGIGSGATAVTALIHNQELFVANCGDSRCVLSRAGKAVEMSYDHKPTNRPEYERITKAGGFVTNGRVNGDLNLSRAIGDLQYKQNADLPPEEQQVTSFPDVKREVLTPEDQFLIIACDGVWDVKTNQQAVDFVTERLQQGIPLATICEQLLDNCLAPDASGAGTDNMTAVIVAFQKNQE